MNYKQLLYIAAGGLLSIATTSSAMDRDGKNYRDAKKDRDIKELWSQKLYTQHTQIIDLKECPNCEKAVNTLNITPQDLFEFESPSCVTLQGSVVHMDNTQCDSVMLWTFDTHESTLKKIEKHSMPQKSGGNFYLSFYAPRHRSSSLLARSVEKSSTSNNEPYIEVGKKNVVFGHEDEIRYEELVKELKTEHKLEFKQGQRNTSITSSKNVLQNAIIVVQPFTKDFHKQEKQCLTVFGAYPCTFLCTLMYLNPQDETKQEKVCCNANGSIVCHYNHKNTCLTVFKQLHGLGEVSTHYGDVLITTQK